METDLVERMQPWTNQSNEEGQNHSSEELVWQQRCFLHATWEAQKGTMHSKTHHCPRTPSWLIEEKDQSPSQHFRERKRKNKDLAQKEQE